MCRPGFTSVLRRPGRIALEHPPTPAPSSKAAKRATCCYPESDLEGTARISAVRRRDRPSTGRQRRVNRRHRSAVQERLGARLIHPPWVPPGDCDSRHLTSRPTPSFTRGKRARGNGFSAVLIRLQHACAQESYDTHGRPRGAMTLSENAAGTRRRRGEIAESQWVAEHQTARSAGPKPGDELGGWFDCNDGMARKRNLTAVGGSGIGYRQLSGQPPRMAGFRGRLPALPVSIVSSRVRCLPRVRHPGAWLPEAAVRRVRSRQAAGVQLQAPRFLPVVRRAAHVTASGAPGRGQCHPARAGSTVGTVAAPALLPSPLVTAHAHCDPRDAALHPGCRAVGDHLVDQAASRSGSAHRVRLPDR